MWKDLSNMGRIIVVSIIPVMWAAWVWMHTTFITAQASEAKWSSHEAALACRTVHDLKEQIRVMESRLQFDKELDDDDREFILKQIKRVRMDIERIDPESKC